MSKKYYGYWGANNGSGNRNPVIFTNKKRAIKTMRSIAQGNVFTGNNGWWRVCDHDGACEHQDCERDSHRIKIKKNVRTKQNRRQVSIHAPAWGATAKKAIEKLGDL